MSVSDKPGRIERLLDRARPARRKRGEADEAAGLQHLVGLLCPDPAPAPAPAPNRAGWQPYNTPGRTA